MNRLPRSGRRALRVAALLILAAAGALLHYHLQPSGEREVRRTIKTLARLLESKDFTRAGEFISNEYRGEFQSSKAVALQKAEAAFREVQDLKIAVEFTEVHLDGAAASVMILYSISGTMFLREFNQRIPFHNIMQEKPGRPEVMYAEFAKNGGAWQTEYITWKTAAYMDQFPEAKARLEEKGR